MTSPARFAPLTLLAACIAAMTLAAVPVAAAPSPERFTALAASVVAPPQPVEASDGRTHLAYELLLINRSYPPAEVTVRGVEALAGGKVVRSLKGESLATVMYPFGGTDTGTRLGKGEAAYVLMDVSLPPGAKPPRRLSHRFSISLRPESKVVAKRFEAAPTAVSKNVALVVAPPLGGGGWIVGNGCCADLTSHRAALLAVNGGLYEGERYAIDFIQVTPSGMLGTGPLDQLASYPFFGDPVYSAAAGKVVAVVDGRPETPPGALPPATAAASAGNHVVVDLGKGRYALYAHLQPGSIGVRVGQRVAAGEQLGRLGSSGNSNAPHLHFQLMDGPDPLASNGVPYRFARFTVAGSLTNFAGLFDGEPARIAPQLRGTHRAQLPLNLQVIGFGG
ncbi:MAG TPA: M23 family metallopeptidase [Solirubrobacterales bacterium]|nr:M23 family metallopeptidase [Solirubrobacterales bacterium]